MEISYYEISSMFIDFIVLLIALRYLGIATDILNIIAIAVIIIIAVFVILSVKDFIPNIISGMVLHQKGSIKVGDIVSVDNITGKVFEINLIETKLKTKGGDTIIIPNSNLTRKEYVLKKRM